MKAYHGIDLHASRLTMHTIVLAQDNGGKERRETKSLRTDSLESAFFPFFGAGDVFCVEASTCTAWFAEQLEKRGYEVIVINPGDLKGIYMTGKKTDKVDARRLAEHLASRSLMGSSDVGAVTLPNEDQRTVRKLFAAYKFFKKEINSIENQISAVFRSKCLDYGYKYFKSHRDECLGNPRIGEGDKTVVAYFEGELEEALRRSKEIRAEIERLSCSLWKEEITLLTTIQGVSVFIAAAVMADILNVERFRNAKKMCSYLCAAPKVDSSNESTRIGSMTKRGRKTSFTLLLQGLNYVRMSNPAFHAFEARKSGKHTCKVRSALIRKTIVAIYFMLRDKKAWKFEDKTASSRKQKQVESILAQIEQNAA